MALPTYENDLVLATTFLLRDDQTREAAVTYAVNDAAENASAQTWAVRLQTEFAFHWDQQVDSAARIMRTTTLKGDGTTDFTVGVSVAAPTRGTNSMSSLPPNCAALGKKITALGGRRNRGRVYVPFVLNEGEVDEIGHISAGVITDLQACFTNWLTAIRAYGDAEMVIANRAYDAPWDNPNRHLTAVTMSGPVTAITAETTIATQRRRMPR